VNNILPFRKKENANSEPIISSDYFGSEHFPLLELLQQIEKLKEKTTK